MTTLVVGAGSSGAAIAARSTEDPDREVVLLEAGPADPGFASEVLDASRIRGAMPGHPANWSFDTRLTPDLDYTVVRGRMLGGSSAINGGYFIRARSGDHARWAEAGGSRWSHDEALPVWRALEADSDFPTAPLHGARGPMPVHRPSAGSLTTAFLEAARARGWRDEPDKNGGQAPGVGPVPSNVVDGVRVSTAAAYLTEAVRHRPGLRIESDTTVGRVIFDGDRAVGVETSRGEIFADEIVLAAGAIGSARILLSSGVGPAADLERLGIRVRADLPVGTAFSDHPELTLSWHPAPGSDEASERVAFPAALHLDSGGHPDGDLEVLLAAASLGELLGFDAPSDVLPLIVGLMSPRSRGRLSLRSADPAAPPRIDYRYLTEGDDRRRLRVGAREAMALAGAMGGRVTDLDDPDDDELDAWMLAHLGTAIHMCGTAPMGEVVDGAGRVHGIAGLRVADTSILPIVPTRGPAASAVLVGEIIARAVRG